MMTVIVTAIHSIMSALMKIKLGVTIDTDKQKQQWHAQSPVCVLPKPVFQ